MKDILEALTKLVEELQRIFGENITLAIIIIGPIVAILYKLYTDWIKRNEINKALEAKDQSIQILNDENRHYRILDLKNRGWDDDAIEKFVLKEMPKNSVEAREMVHNSKLLAKKRASKIKKEDDNT